MSRRPCPGLRAHALACARLLRVRWVEGGQVGAGQPCPAPYAVGGVLTRLVHTIHSPGSKGVVSVVIWCERPSGEQCPPEGGVNDAIGRGRGALPAVVGFW